MDKKEQAALRYIENKEIIDARNKLWAQNNPDRVRQHQLKYRNKNKTKMSLNRKRKYARDKAENTLYFRTYRKKFPEKARWHSLLSSAHQRDIPVLMTRAEFIDWHMKQPPQCHYCGLVDLSLDDRRGNPGRTFTIDRRDSNLPYTIQNLARSCWWCNRGKSDIFTYDEWMFIGQKFMKPKWQKKLELINAPS